MADSKITALTALTTADPATDMFPVVDVSDTTMAASGTTKRISINNILACSPTATLASATITGDLTVATNRLVVNASGVCIGTTTATPFAGNTKAVVGGGSGAIGLTLYGGVANTTGLYYADGIVGNETYRGYLEYSHATDSFAFGTAGVNRYTIDSTGISTWSVAGSTAMTLNSTGLGVGGSPASKLTAIVAPPASGSDGLRVSDGTRIAQFAITGSSYSYKGVGALQPFIYSIGGPLNILSDNNEIKLITGTGNVTNIDSFGNVGVGVTPSAWISSWKAIDINTDGAGLSGTAAITNLTNNCFLNASAQWIYKGSFVASRYQQSGGEHQFYSAVAGTGGVAIGTFTQAMTLDASGNLLVGKTTSGVNTDGSQIFPGGACSLGHVSGTASGTVYAAFGLAGVQIGSITQNGTTGVLYNIVSDYRLKESVKPISSGLARVNALKPSSYNWKSDGSTGEGFLAHELAEVVPFAVSGEKDAVSEDGKIKPQGIDMSRIVPILVAAIQELTARVQTLEAK
jgi:hypothetical protein